MLLETVRLSISPEIFDVHFLDFVNEEWKDALLIQHRIEGVRLRYDVYLPKLDKSEENLLVAEIERNIVIDKQLDIRVVAIDIESPSTHLFINTFYYFLYEKWDVNARDHGYDEQILTSTLESFIRLIFRQYDINDWDYLASHELEVPNKFPPQTTAYVQLLPNFYTEKVLEDTRRRILNKLQQRLPPIEKYPGYISVPKKKKTGRPGLDEADLLLSPSKGPRGGRDKTERSPKNLERHCVGNKLADRWNYR